MSLLLLSKAEQEGAQADSRPLVTAPKAAKMRRFAVRRHERVPVEYAGMIHWKGSHGGYEFASGITIDISEAGVALASDRPVSAASVFVCIPGLSFASYAEVRRTMNCGSGCVVGLEFRGQRYDEQRAAPRELIAPGLQALADVVESFVVPAIVSLPPPESTHALPESAGPARPVCVDSQVVGDVEMSGARLIIGPTSCVNAKLVRAREVIVLGAVEGDVDAPERVEVRSGGRLRGNVRTALFLLEPGGHFEGRVEQARR